MRIWKISWKVH